MYTLMQEEEKDVCSHAGVNISQMLELISVSVTQVDRRMRNAGYLPLIFNLCNKSAKVFGLIW